MRCLQPVEKQNAQLANVLGVCLVVFETAREASGAGDYLASRGVITVGLFPRESVVRNFLEDPFADTNSGNGHAADIQVTAQSNQRDGGNAHDIGAIATHGVGFHSLADIALQNVGQAVAQERQLQHGETMFTWAGRDAS